MPPPDAASPEEPPPFTIECVIEADLQTLRKLKRIRDSSRRVDARAASPPAPGEVREVREVDVVRPTERPDAVPDGQFGPYGDFAPSTPPVEGEGRARAASRESEEDRGGRSPTEISNGDYAEVYVKNIKKLKMADSVEKSEKFAPPAQRERCRGEGCAFLAHPRPEQENIEPGYCCNLCFGRSTKQEWATSRTARKRARGGRGGHYKNCLRELAADVGGNAAFNACSPAAAAASQTRGRSRQSGRSASRSRSHVTVAESDGSGSRTEVESPEPEQLEGAIRRGGCYPLFFCPECQIRMVWDNWAGGPYELGWRCMFFDECGVQSFRPSKLPQAAEARWFCRQCSVDVCGACGATGGIRRAVRDGLQPGSSSQARGAMRPTQPKSEPPAHLLAQAPAKRPRSARRAQRPKGAQPRWTN